MSLLNVSVENTRGTVILRCLGRLVLGAETSLLCAALQYDQQEVILDLGGVSAIDAAGIGALVALQAAGAFLKLANPTEPICQILHSLGLDSIFPILSPAPCA